MKVLAVIIAHPLRKISGATNAGRELSIATANLVDLELAIMWDRDEVFTIGKLKVWHVRCTNPLSAAASWLPRSALVPLYDSPIPKVIQKGDYDLVHIHNLIPAFAAERVARACRRRNIPYVVSAHGFNEQSRYAQLNGFGRFKSALADVAVMRPFRRIVKRAAAIFALSDCEGELLASLGVDDDRVHLVTNGVNEFYLEPPAPAEVVAVREKFAIGFGPRLLFMGSLHAYKGVDVFLQSLRDVRGPFQAVVAGQFKSDDERVSLLRKAGIDGGAVPRLVFTGAVSDEELRALYHLTDLFVYPTRGDTFPLVVLEAMASGLPVVSTTVGGVPFVVGPEQGALVPPGDPRAVADAVNALLVDPERRRRMGESAKAKIRERFRWSASAKRAVEGYRIVLERWRSSREKNQPSSEPSAGERAPC